LLLLASSQLARGDVPQGIPEDVRCPFQGGFPRSL
jgi:hypothetical protein